ncbi:MAG: hypothetical protein COB85_09420 [Bacteroidetes bacterium]|nr:MAG: hypothetical protein COB85_09420 [Bacteroidota bacterium]
MNTNNENSNEVRKELEDIAPSLSKIDRANPFEVPDNYFDNLPGVVSDRINGHSTPHSSTVRALVIRWTAVAASIILIAVLTFVLTNSPEGNINLDLAQLDLDEIEEVLMDQGIYAVEEEELIDMLLDSDEESFLEEINDLDEIIDYLIDNNIDLTTIVEELES